MIWPCYMRLLYSPPPFGGDRSSCRRARSDLLISPTHSALTRLTRLTRQLRLISSRPSLIMCISTRRRSVHCTAPLSSPLPSSPLHSREFPLLLFWNEGGGREGRCILILFAQLPLFLRAGRTVCRALSLLLLSGKSHNIIRIRLLFLNPSIQSRPPLSLSLSFSHLFSFSAFSITIQDEK